MSEAAVTLTQYLMGEVAEANALQQLLHLYRKEPRSVLKALGERANSLVANSDASPASAKMGIQLIQATLFLDAELLRNPLPAPAASSKATDGEGEEPRVLTRVVGKRPPDQSSKLPLHACQPSRALLEHLLLLAGGVGKAAKQRAVRVQNCSLIAGLAAAAPGPKVEAKLLEFALDKVPAIREQAVIGLATLEQTPKVEQAILDRTSDHAMSVRQAAVRHMKITSRSALKLLDRASDVQVTVRVQVFERFAEQPEAVHHLGPAAFTRLVLGLADRSSLVRQAAVQAVTAWHKALGGLLSMVTRCDVLEEDEEAGEAATGALAGCFPQEGEELARNWLAEKLEPAKKAARHGEGELAARASVARHAIVAMPAAEREAINVPIVLERAQRALEDLEKCSAARRPLQEFILKQLLLISLSLDFCEDSMRHTAIGLAEAVLLRAPLPKIEMSLSIVASKVPLNCLELGVALLRKSCGLAQNGNVQGSRWQALEVDCSTRVAMLLGDACPVGEEEGGEGDEALAGGGFTQGLSQKLVTLNGAVDEVREKKAKLESQKQTAAGEEDYLKAHDAQRSLARVEKELSSLEKERDRLQSQRDGVCLRVVGILTALLRWSHTDLRRDNPLASAFQYILRPMVTLPALSPEVEVASLRAICLFCSISPKLAKSHWGLFTLLINHLKDNMGTEQTEEVKQKACVCAALAAQALADCCLYHGPGGGVDTYEVLGAGIALSIVPFHAREVVMRPLCSWLLSSGAVFVDEHCQEPVLEVQWALGWLLVEAFSVSSEDPEAASESMKASAAQLWDFFSFLSKHPGRHVKPMLSLAVESVAESGLWRRGMLKPLAPKPGDGPAIRWQRGFDWPQLFAFAHEQLPPEMRFRLWRCSLQLCVASPEHAPLAQIDKALTLVQKDAPRGASELVTAAIDLGADASLLGALQSSLPAPRSSAELTAKDLLQHPSAGRAAERMRRDALVSLGVDIATWAPQELEAPKALPPTVRSRGASAAKKADVHTKADSSQ